MELEVSLEHVFVYGTLKRGQCREGCWPRAAAMVRPAWTLGRLLDLGPYPALVAGNDRVRGELWSFASNDMPLVVCRLDQIEVTNQPGLVNEYDRIHVVVYMDDGQALSAYAYRYSAHQPTEGRSVVLANTMIDGEDYVVWIGQAAT